MTKAERNKAHYEKHADKIKQRRKLVRAETKKLKTFAELMHELAPSHQIAEAKLIACIAEKSGVSPTKVAVEYKKLLKSEKLTEHQRIHVNNNDKLKHRLMTVVEAL
ncbi:TPA: hypothetical protein ACGUM0_003943 [Vibrio vulnificus]